MKLSIFYDGIDVLESIHEDYVFVGVHRTPKGKLKLAVKNPVGCRNVFDLDKAKDFFEYYEKHRDDFLEVMHGR